MRAETIDYKMEEKTPAAQSELAAICLLYFRIFAIDLIQFPYALWTHSCKQTKQKTWLNGCLDKTSELGTERKE